MDEQKPQVESPGGGTAVWQGMGFQAIDLAHEAFPAAGVVLMIMPKQGIEPIGQAEVPKGSIIMFIEPALAAQLRVQFKAGQPTSRILRPRIVG